SVSAAVTCSSTRASSEEISQLPACLARIHAFREFQGSGTVSSECPRGEAMRKSVPSNAAVMLRFTRVVALPDPKIVIFPAESILSYGWIAGYVQMCGDYKLGALLCASATLRGKISFTQRRKGRRKGAKKQLTSNKFYRVNGNRRLLRCGWRRWFRSPRGRRWSG